MKRQQQRRTLQSLRLAAKTKYILALLPPRSPNAAFTAIFHDSSMTNLAYKILI